jgi:DMSO/TMAO reductase YedYZ molybdopterin-dependent catalytic subunit
MTARNILPPGQVAIDHFPRFGLLKYARRFKTEFDPLGLLVSGEVLNPITLTAENLSSLPRTGQTSDFHCVTTWSRHGLHWGGVRFSDFYRLIVQPKAQPSQEAQWVIFRGQDGFRARLPLADLLADDVLLADSLDGAALTAKHGAPLRLVAPAHYGYKNVKHLKAIEFQRDAGRFQPPAFRFMDHPRARVAFEERGHGVPAWLLRFLYRPVVRPTIRLFERSMHRE